MADVHSPAVRSKNMRAIRNQNTAIEKMLSQLLNEAGIAYRTQATDLPVNLILFSMNIKPPSLCMDASGIAMIAICLRYQLQEQIFG